MTGAHDRADRSADHDGWSDDLEAEMADAAEFFDAEFYAAAHPTVAARTDDLLQHFCSRGWRELRKPNAGFDVWWYWVNHLDPATDQVNPLVHYARVGRAAGLSTRPQPVPPGVSAGTGTELPRDRPIRRACLFAGFDADGTVDEAVLVYLRDLARFADVYCLFDNHLPTSELAKLQEVAAGAWAIRHGAYDFGSYAMLARDLVGWDRLASYDEVLFVNDSCYLLRPLDDVFSRMDAEACDWWGMQATKGLAMTRDAPGNQFSEPVPLSVVRQDLLATFEDDGVYDFHVGSYFLAFRGPVVADPVFRKLVESVGPQSTKRAIIQKYEIGLTHVLIGRGHTFSTYVSALYPFHPMFTAWAFALIEVGLPLLKRYFLYQNHYDTPGLVHWKDRVRALVPDAPLEVFEENLLRTAPADRLHRSFAIDTAPDGTVEVPVVLSGPRFVTTDKKTPKRPDWWVFVVDPVTHALPANSRAVFDRVAADPDLTKIILTRSRRVELAGTQVLSEPLLSPEGRQHLLGAGTIFVAEQPATALGVQARPRLHDVIAVRSGLQLLRHGRTAASSAAGSATRSRPGSLQMLHTPAKPTLTAVLTASEIDQVAEIASHWPARYGDGWRTGLPLHDQLLPDELLVEGARDAALPADVVTQQGQLRRALAGRRLVLFAPIARRTGSALPPYPFSAAEVEQLVGWARDHDAVLGIREPLGDLERPYSSVFGESALDLSPQRFPAGAAVLRCADVLLTDYAGTALDFTVTGRPVVSFAHDLDAAADRLLYDLDHLFPGPVCRDFHQLAETLKTIFDPPSFGLERQYRRVRDLLIDHRDGGSAARVVERVRALSEHP